MQTNTPSERRQQIEGSLLILALLLVLAAL